MKKKYTQRKNIFRQIKKFFLSMSNLQIILISYFFVVMIASCLLFLPISQKEGVEPVSFIDALFTAASAFSDTGLTMRVTVETWNDLGIFIIAFLILIGGIGIFALKVWIINIVFKKSISLTSRNILEKERGTNNAGELKKTIKNSVTFLFITIVIFTFILWIIFYFETGQFKWTSGEINPATGLIEKENIKDYEFANPKGDILLSFKCAIFHTISAINNAGFDILSDSSLYPYYNVYSIQIIFIILLVIGGIGFPVIYDVIQYISHKIRRRTDFRFSLFSKVSSITYIIVFLVGLLLTLLFELVNTSSDVIGIWNSKYTGTTSDKIMCIIFHVFSTRNAGFTTLDSSIAKFTSPTLIIFSILMFIGSAPSSTAGGIRTTTLAIILVAIWNKIRGVKSVRMFKRNINDEVVSSSFVVFALSVFIVFISSIICFTSLDTIWGDVPSHKFTFTDIIFDVSSAFGTTGLSTGLVNYLNIGSKIILIITMFIGQLGISSTMLAWRKLNKKNSYSYIEEDILIG